MSRHEQRLETTDDLARLARDMGYTGLIIRNVADEGRFGQGYSLGTTIFVAFDPAQIKSVHNSGSWDPSSADLLDRLPEPEAVLEEEDDLCPA